MGDHEDPIAEVSVFEHLAETYAPVPLRTTYRMNSGINAFPSKTFYDGGLTPSTEAGARRFPAVPGGDYDAIFDPEVPALLVEVAHEGHRTRCDAEARVVSALASDLLGRQGFDPREFAIVSPYRAQLRAIRSRLRREVEGPLPVIDTVERIQGQERECVIVSLAASDPDWLAGEQAEFFYSPNRLNVTLTRAGQVLLDHARRLFVAMENAVAATRQAADPDSGLLRVGASVTACQYIVPEALREFRESFPAYSLRITPGDIGARPFTTAETEDAVSLVAQDAGGEWLGVVSVEREPGREKRRHVAWLVRMYVSQSAAGKGIGRALLRAGIQRARRMPGIAKLNLTVAASNERAVRLYESEGFRTFSRETDAFRNGTQSVEELTMSLAL